MLWFSFLSSKRMRSRVDLVPLLSPPFSHIVQMLYRIAIPVLYNASIICLLTNIALPKYIHTSTSTYASIYAFLSYLNYHIQYPISSHTHSKSIPHSACTVPLLNLIMIIRDIFRSTLQQLVSCRYFCMMFKKECVYLLLLLCSV